MQLGTIMGFPGGSAGKESAWNAGDLGLIPGLERSPGEENGHPLQYSGLENSIDFIVHGVTKSGTWLSNFHFTSLFRDYHAKWSKSERDAFLPLIRKPCRVLCPSPVLCWLSQVPEGEDDVFSIYAWHTTIYSLSEMLSYMHMWLTLGRIIDGQASSFIFRL